MLTLTHTSFEIKLATASADATIKVWKTIVPEEDEPIVNDSAAPRKKKRTEKKDHLTKVGFAWNWAEGRILTRDIDRRKP